MRIGTNSGKGQLEISFYDDGKLTGMLLFPFGDRKWPKEKGRYSIVFDKVGGNDLILFVEGEALIRWEGGFSFTNCLYEVPYMDGRRLWMDLQEFGFTVANGEVLSSRDDANNVFVPCRKTVRKVALKKSGIKMS